MAVLSADSFNRADSTTTLGSTDGAGSLDPIAWTKPNGGGPHGISSNRAYCPGGNGLAAVDLATADVDITLTVVTMSGGSGIMFRFASFNNYWFWMNTSTGSVSQLYKVVGGSFTQVGSSQSGAANGDVLRVVTNGNAIEVFRNGTSKITTTDSFAASGTNHGLYFQSASDLIDAFSASNLVSGMIFTGTQATETDTA